MSAADPPAADPPAADPPAAALDAADPLADRRAAFRLPSGVVYLDGNSLGPLSRAAEARVAAVTAAQWGDSLIGGWNAHGWIDLPARVGDRIAGLIGAPAGAVLACDSTTVNLFKLLAAALALRPDRDVVLSDEESFPTDLYAAESLFRVAGRGRLRLAPRARLLEALDGDVAALMVTQVDYRSAHLLDLTATTRAAHAEGAVMLWDLAHSAGALPVDLTAAGAEFAVGCGYKYLNGGPGAPAFAYVRPDLADALAPAPAGWMGHARPFAFEPAYAPAPGVARLQVGTPPILSLAALDAALEAFEDVSMAALRAKSVALSERFIARVEAAAPAGALRLASPRDPARRGSHVSFACAHGRPVMQALIARGVIGDFRAPDLLRFGFAPLYTRFAEVDAAAAALADVLRTRAWDDPAQRPAGRVT